MTVQPYAHNEAQVQVSLDNVVDLDQAWRVAEILAQSDIVPASLRNKPANVLLVYMTGREMGLSFAQAVRTIYVPTGGQPQMRGSLLLAKLREAGHDYRWAYTTDGNGCTFYITRGDNKQEYEASFNVDDAIAAGLVKRAANGELVAYSQSNRPLPWMQYRQDMLFWRAVARAVNRAVPEVILGFEIMGHGEQHTPEVTLQPQQATRPAEPKDASPAEPSATPDTQELADLNARGAVSPPTAPQGGAPEGPATEPAPPAAPGRARDTQPADGKARPAQQKAVTDRFQALGWDVKNERPQVLAACTAYCQRRITSASDLKSTEAIGLATALGAIFRQGDAEHHPVLLGEQVEKWKREWEEANPDSFESVYGAPE